MRLLTHLQLNPIIALDDIEFVCFIPFRRFAALLMRFRAPFHARGRRGLQEQNAIRIVFAEEISCKGEMSGEGNEGMQLTGRCGASMKCQPTHKV